MTKGFEQIKEHCVHQSRIGEKVLDGFLMNFIGQRERMDQKMNAYEKKYRHVIRKMPEGFFPTAMGEIIIGKALAHHGVIHKYLKNVQLLSLDPAERAFLEFQANNPWRYCFAYIAGHPAKEFFLLRDAFVEDEFLLYSPGMEGFWAEGRKQDLYFLLVGFNGQCWQTYGVIVAMRSFDPDDIYFYGAEIFSEVDSDAALMESVYKDPMPYLMLACGMEYPIVMSGDQVLRQMVAVDEINSIETEKLKKHFSIQWNKDIYRISHKEWSGPPCFASAYYNEKRGELSRFAMTREGFDALTRMLIQSGLHIGGEEDYSVGMSMLMTMQEILNKKIKLNEYEKYFPEKNDNTVPQKELDNINRFMNLLLPYINAGTQPDLSTLARQAGIDPEEAQSLYDQLKNKFGRG
ncbi:MAG: hypothetical protein H8E51_11010 [Bacteroidetes bacterium]|nr:hypothetical protein [Bacteroidota bacterium]